MPETGYTAGFTGRRGKFKQHMYYRRPDKGEHRRWIVVGGRGDVEDMSQLGFEPLWKFGLLRKTVPGTNEGEQNIWATILEHPDGPAAFPAEQVMISRWYRPEDCPVLGVTFPQLAGHKVKEYQCPECRRPAFAAIDGFGAIEPLGRHLRLIHRWDRVSLVRYGEKVGIDFDAIYSNIEKEYEFEGEAPRETPEEAPEETPEEKPGILVGEFDCDQCDWKPKPNAKRPGFALMMHKKTHKVAVPA